MGCLMGEIFGDECHTNVNIGVEVGEEMEGLRDRRVDRSEAKKAQMGGTCVIDQGSKSMVAE